MSAGTYRPPAVPKPALKLSPTSTLAREGVRIFLCEAHEQDAAIQELERHRYSEAMKHRPTALHQALFRGAWELRKSLTEDIKTLTARGGLLHYGCVKIAPHLDGYRVLGSAL